MAIKRGARRPRDLLGPVPQTEEPEELPEQEGGDENEGKPQEGVELPGGEIPEEVRGSADMGFGASGGGSVCGVAKKEKAQERGGHR